MLSRHLIFSIPDIHLHMIPCKWTPTKSVPFEKNSTSSEVVNSENAWIYLLWRAENEQISVAERTFPRTVFFNGLVKFLGIILPSLGMIPQVLRITLRNLLNAIRETSLFRKWSFPTLGIVQKYYTGVQFWNPTKKYLDLQCLVNWKVLRFPLFGDDFQKRL